MEKQMVEDGWGDAKRDSFYLLNDTVFFHRVVGSSYLVQPTFIGMQIGLQTVRHTCLSAGFHRLMPKQKMGL